MADTDKIKQLRSYLNHKARIAITDGRVFVDEHRQVGLIMIPGQHLLKMDIEDLETMYL
ncbi:hypothetical protein BX666DRAFT_2022614 [Dichotomocladium elegans]|nr:hypothetical protein BX666DRAFT_2022614 [Dichotomocladium elegans]